MRTCFSPYVGPVSEGKDPAELWGTSDRDRGKRNEPYRSEQARARRRAKRSARLKDMPLKAYLRKQK